jgi:hypothetical protein
VLEHQCDHGSRPRCIKRRKTVSISPSPGFNVEEKRKDPRYGWFVANHGRRCWELDAMSPVDLRARVKTEICSYIDEEAWDFARKAQAAEIATINTVCNNWTKITKAISDPERK